MLMFNNTECERYYDEVRELASAAGKDALSEFDKTIAHLNGYACPQDDAEKKTTQCWLRPDFSPWSFNFSLKVLDKNGNYQPWFFGGVIYSGPGLNDEGGVRSDGTYPSLSCSIDPVCASGSAHRWSVHT